ncbi:MAG: Uma2 family endonuclease [Thermoflexibacter sp.]|nr:Uma2 family endonuclease [Thermoflexibacter sp.]
MDLVVETTSEKQLSAYEIERKKHTPTLIHGAIQANLIVLIAVKYPNLFRIASEVALATQPDGSTPDLVLYPFSELDYKNDPARRTDAPLLVVEIQSPSQSSKDMTEKLEPYFYFGIKSCWIVVPDFQGVFVYSNAFTYEFFHHDEILTDTTLNIEIDLKDIFK